MTGLLFLQTCLNDELVNLHLNIEFYNLSLLALEIESRNTHDVTDDMCQKDVLQKN